MSICQQPRFFTLQEADELVPIISRITKHNEREVQKLLDKQRYMLKSGAPQERITEADTLVGKHLVDWGAKLTKLGCKVFGMGYVGFDCGSGFWSWHEGDGDKVNYFHGYMETPLQRREVMRNVHIQKIE